MPRIKIVSSNFIKLPPEQERALRIWNEIITSLNDGQMLSGNCLRTRLTALSEYCNGANPLLKLEAAFKTLYPHWLHSMAPIKTIRDICEKLYSSAWIPYAEAIQYRIPTAPLQSKENLSIPENPSMILERRCCIIHPNKPVSYKRLGLCCNCRTKAIRLGILHLITLPMSEIIQHVMATRQYARGRGNPKLCVNHESRPSFDGTFCAECLINIENARESNV